MIVFFSALLILSSFSAEITEGDIRSSILKNFPLIQEAEMKVESSRGEVTAAKGAFDTKLKIKHRNHIEDRYDNEYSEVSLEKLTSVSGIKLVGGHRQGTGLYAPYEGKFDTSSAGEIFAGLSLPLLRNRSVDEFRLETSFAGIHKEMAETEARIKKNLYMYKGLSLYQKWRLAFQTRLTLKGILKIAEERQDMLRQRFKAGDVERIKLTDNERSILKRKEEILKAEMEYRQVSLQLSLYYRNDQGSPIDLTSYTPQIKSIPPKTVLPVTKIVLPQLKLIELEMEKNRRLNNFYDNQKLPSLNIEALASRELAPDYPYDPQRIHLGLVFEYPFANRKAEGKTVSAAYKGRALEKRKAWTENEFTTLFKQSQELALLAAQRAKIMSEELEKARLVAEAERKRWKQGDSDLFVVALREQEMADVEIKLWKAHYELEQTILDAQLYSSILVL